MKSRAFGSAEPILNTFLAKGGKGPPFGDCTMDGSLARKAIPDVDRGSFFPGGRAGSVADGRSPTLREKCELRFHRQVRCVSFPPRVWWPLPLGWCWVVGRCNGLLSTRQRPLEPQHLFAFDFLLPEQYGCGGSARRRRFGGSRSLERGCAGWACGGQVPSVH